jgi:hypothetical protein
MLFQQLKAGQRPRFLHHVWSLCQITEDNKLQIKIQKIWQRQHFTATLSVNFTEEFTHVELLKMFYGNQF